MLMVFFKTYLCCSLPPRSNPLETSSLLLLPSLNLQSSHGLSSLRLHLSSSLP